MEKPMMTPELEGSFYELLAAARAVSNMPLGTGNLDRLDRMVQVIDDLTDNPPTQRMPSVPVAQRHAGPAERLAHHGPR
jgi:hypothetical protein